MPTDPTYTWLRVAVLLLIVGGWIVRLLIQRDRRQAGQQPWTFPPDRGDAAARSPVPLPPPGPIAEPKRRGKWKSRRTPLDLITFVLPREWAHETSPDGSATLLAGPLHESGWQPVVAIEVLPTPIGGIALQDALIAAAEQKPGYALIQSTRIGEGEHQAAAIHYTYDQHLVPITVRQIAFTVGHRSLAFAEARCPTQLWAQYAETMEGVLTSVKPMVERKVETTVKPVFEDGDAEDRATAT